ncbi:GMC family oxidoreductase N-terminal domain-containing protein [Sphingobium sp. PNB]|uniref:GMC family oxidoreductase n=1 Tax=Sphingobium sp. PNB TaxID=863934 RepID=UPI001D01303A|nr:GMC family oxidoreductase N-terminal domain-containing protein [Sphingobium sp. PNB]MCB4858452.1 GMC family oxidoreductase N-terminal domain-containing protein [Sphingobium sp. PNB]
MSGVQDWLTQDYDVIVCGSGSAGSVVARRLSDNPDLKVLLVEAGGDDHRPSIVEPGRWPENLGSDVDWGFMAEPGAHIDNRSIPMSMGKVFGGGSSINVMIWARGHRRDWDHYAKVSGDPGWSYESVLGIYRRIEDYRGPMDFQRRGAGGLVTVTQSSDPHPVASALVGAAADVGIPTFESPNGEMMESPAGAALSDVRLNDGRRLSVFASYIRPVLDRANLAVVKGVRVRRVLFDGVRATGIEVDVGGSVHALRATSQVVLSTGAINTPKILMLSGIGDRATLASHGITTLRHLPGVGQGLQDHTNFPMVWAHPEAIHPRANGSEATIYANTAAASEGPNVVMCQAEFPLCSPELAQRGAPEHGWSLVAGLSQPKSRGRVLLSSADPDAAPIIHLDALSDPEDRAVARAMVGLAEQIGAAQPLARIGAREAVSPRALGLSVDAFIQQSALPFWHQSCTARMGVDANSVVGGDLKVHGVENLTIADASILPRIPAGNTMAPCVIIGERAGEILSGELG